MFLFLQGHLFSSQLFVFCVVFVFVLGKPYVWEVIYDLKNR